MEQIKYYMAPMEGVTGYVYRNAYAKYYGGIVRYFTPFVANKKLGHREKNDVCPEHNAGMAVVPQILTNRAEDFLAIAEILREYGYDTVNLNLGCPSGTVAARGRGAGFLAMPDELDHFLEEIFEKCPLRISIKTRIGKENPAEWERLLAIYEKYPLEELIVHRGCRPIFIRTGSIWRHLHGQRKTADIRSVIMVTLWTQHPRRTSGRAFRRWISS